MTVFPNKKLTFIDPNKEVFNFGKHEGRTFEEVRKSGAASYIIWVAENLNKYKNRIPKEFILKCLDCIHAAQDARGYSDQIDYDEDDYDDHGFDMW